MTDATFNRPESQRESLVGELVDLTAARPAADSPVLARYQNDWSTAQAELLEYWSELGDQYKTVVVERTYDFAESAWSVGGFLPHDSPEYAAIRRLTTAAYNSGDLDLLTHDRRANLTGVDAAKAIVIRLTAGNVIDELRGLRTTNQLWAVRTPEFVGMATSGRAVNNRDALDVASHFEALTPSERKELLVQITRHNENRSGRNERHATIVCALVQDLASGRSSEAFPKLLALAETLNPRQWDREASQLKMIESRGRAFDALFDFPFGNAYEERNRQQALRTELFSIAPSHWARRATGQDLDLLAQSRGRSMDSVGRDLVRVAFRGEPHSEHVGKLLTQSRSGLWMLASSEHVQLRAMSLPHLDADRAVELIGTEALTVAEAVVQLVSVVGPTRVAGNDVAGSAFADYSVTTMRHVAMFGSRVIDLTPGNEGRKRRLRENLSAIVAFADATEALRQATGPVPTISVNNRLSNEFDFASRNLPCD
jgi:hypothetical protein